MEERKTIKELVASVGNLIPNVSDRTFCKIFDSVALESGYSTDTLPPYWTIIREWYRYKAFKKKNEVSVS